MNEFTLTVTYFKKKFRLGLTRTEFERRSEAVKVITKKEFNSSVEHSSMNCSLKISKDQYKVYGKISTKKQLTIDASKLELISSEPCLPIGIIMNYYSWRDFHFAFMKDSKIWMYERNEVESAHKLDPQFKRYYCARKFCFTQNNALTTPETSIFIEAGSGS